MNDPMTKMRREDGELSNTTSRIPLLLLRCLCLSLIAFVLVHFGTPTHSNRRRTTATTTTQQTRQRPDNHPSHRARRSLQQQPANNASSLPYYTIPTNGTQALRAKLLTNYDKYSYPIEEYWKGNNRTGLPVQLALNFHRVFSVTVTQSKVDLIVWVRQTWNDPRLTWDPAEYNNITSLHFWIGDGIGTGETSEIWSPDLHLWNAAEPLAETLADAHAIVSADGSVFWTRPGHVRPACKFEGLHAFPFDTLGCTIEMGSWGYSGLYLRPVKLEEGFSIGGSQTAGEAYAEFKLDAVDVEEFVYPPFIEAPTEDWPVLLYTVRFVRAWQPYARSFLILQVVLNLVGFCSFWLPPHTGERMGLSMTALLASVASELVVTEKLPAFGEMSWVTRFSLASLIFTALALLENIIVIYLHYHTGSRLVPRWMQWLIRQGRRQVQTVQRKREQMRRDVQEGTMNQSETGHTVRASAFPSSSLRRWHEEVQVDDDIVSDDDASKDSSSHLDTPNETLPIVAMEKTEHSRPRPRYQDGMWQHRASVRQGIKTILGRDPDDFKSHSEMENNARWQKAANQVDEFSRVVFPLVYTIYLAVSFSKAGAI